MSTQEILARYAPAPPVVPSTELELDDPRLPTSVQRAVKAAREAGLAPRVFWAGAQRDDRVVYTVGVRVERPDRLVAMLWQFHDRDKSPWAFEGAWTKPGRPRRLDEGGREYAFPVDLVSSAEALELIKGA